MAETKQEWLDSIMADVKEHGEVYWQGVYEDLTLKTFQKYCHELGLDQIEDEDAEPGKV